MENRIEVDPEIGMKEEYEVKADEMQEMQFIEHDQESDD